MRLDQLDLQLAEFSVTIEANIIVAYMHNGTLSSASRSNRKAYYSG
jgi:hypothetical protein